MALIAQFAAYPMRDWPKHLRVSAMACRLARVVYFCWRMVYRPGAPPWRELPTANRDIMIDYARRLLNRLDHQQGVVVSMKEHLRDGLE